MLPLPETILPPVGLEVAEVAEVGEAAGGPACASDVRPSANAAAAPAAAPRALDAARERPDLPRPRAVSAIGTQVLRARLHTNRYTRFNDPWRFMLLLLQHPSTRVR